MLNDTLSILKILFIRILKILMSIMKGICLKTENIKYIVLNKVFFIVVFFFLLHNKILNIPNEKTTSHNNNNIVKIVDILNILCCLLMLLIHPIHVWDILVPTTGYEWPTSIVNFVIKLQHTEIAYLKDKTIFLCHWLASIEWNASARYFCLASINKVFSLLVFTYKNLDNTVEEIIFNINMYEKAEKKTTPIKFPK